MKKGLALLLVLMLGISMLLIAGCGGSGDALKGTWEGTYEDGDASWTFDGKGACTITSIVLDKSPGKYTIKDGEKVDITLDLWDAPLTYTYKIEGTKLTLTADNGYSPNYELTKK